MDFKDGFEFNLLMIFGIQIQKRHDMALFLWFIPPQCQQ